nr:hypothetical protein [Holophaga foetida]
MDLCALTESDICDQFITPAIQAAGWDPTTQIRREVSYTAGRIWVRGRIASRSKKRKRADYVLYFRAGIPLAVVEAKDANRALGAGMQQAIDNAAYRTLASLDTLNASAKLRHLRDLGLLEQKGKGSATHYIAAGPLAGAPQPDKPQALSDMSQALPDMPPPLPDMSDPEPDILAEMPRSLRAKVQALPQRVKLEDLQRLVLELSAWRELEPQKLARILDRNLTYLRENLFYPLIEVKRLEFRYPESPRHPRQAYRTAPGALKEEE